VIEEILGLDKINKNSEVDYIFNFSKFDQVHLQSPSLIKIKETTNRQKHFILLTKTLEKNKYVDQIELTENGFINVTLHLSKVLKYLQKSKEEILETIKDRKPKKYIFDYGGPNIGKSMHVGHLRPLNIGRALYNIYKISGNNCTSDIHLGDWGIPISQILTYCYENNIEIKNLSDKDLQEIYPKASKLTTENIEFKNKVAQNLSKLNEKSQNLYNDWKIVSNITINSIEKLLLKLNHKFDLFYGESTVVDLIPQMIESLKNNNYVAFDDGALISKEKVDPPVLILKSDSTYLYMTTDLATVLDREQKISPDEYFYIVDSRQSAHFKQLFSSIKYFNFSKSNFKHIGFGTINDAEGKPFKTRQGDVYPLEDLWQDIYKILIRKNNKNNAHILTNSVLVFSDLLIDRSSNYKFDVEKFTNTEGKTAIYIQYTRVRIKSILKNLNQIEYLDNFDKLNLTDAEKDLILSILKFSDTFKRSKKHNEPHHLAEYLYELCQRFNSFYKKSRILDEANMELQNRRLNILIVCLEIIEIIFDILGIETVEEM
tara:strand:- start:1436 stop:3067 length:1632 start_codon:yes stop_codon:yes gene_type:complete